ncbi:DUF692 domain-containing protein [Pseudonocardia abyssalis]|uniref:DUF692 domain-containing protein n=1 Tax=Pseudonocardia abyssalis TaxID=2792008 RepID=UPI0027DFCCFF|nr:DUF692 domain-containing protein [Pseudonocardia abyssalis]
MVAEATGALPTGLGIGWRSEIAGVVSAIDALGFTEVIAESLAPADPPRGVADLRGRGVPVVPHGVRLSLGGTDALDAGRVTHLAACAAALGAPLVSEHVAFVRAGGRDAGHLLPLPRSREALDVLVANVARTQAELDVPLALEPVAALFDWPDDEYTEGEFLTALLDRTGALLLLDVANVHANAVNRGQDPEAVLESFPLDRIAYVHVAGGAEHDGLHHDTHTAAVPDAVLGLLSALVDRLPAPPAVMLERDGHYPPAAALHAELAAIRSATAPARRGPAVRGSGPAGRGPAARGSGSFTGAPLTDRQTVLVANLVAGGPRPPAVDPGRLDATRRALLRKRAGLAAVEWPLLAASYGDRWASVFARHRDGCEPVGALRDGWDVARSVDDLGPGAARELAERESALRYDGRSTPLPRLRTRVRRRLRI